MRVINNGCFGQKMGAYSQIESEREKLPQVELKREMDVCVFNSKRREIHAGGIPGHKI